MTSNTDLVSWIAGHLEGASYGTTVVAAEVYQAYAKHCSESPGTLYSATTDAMGKVLRDFFPHVVHTHRRYDGLYWKKTDPEQSLQLPEYCTLTSTASGMSISVATNHVVDGHNLTIDIQIRPDLSVEMYIGENKISLANYGISEQLPDKSQPSVDGVVIPAYKANLCRGVPRQPEHEEAKSAVRERWSALGFESYGEDRTRTKTCLRFIPFNSKAGISTCTSCRKFYRYHSKKRKLAALDSESETDDTEATLGEDGSRDLASILENVLPSAPSNFEMLLQSQLDNCGKHPKQRRWPPKLISICMALCNRSVPAYEILRNSDLLVLPSVRLLRLYKKSLSEAAEVSEDSLDDQ